MKSIVLASVFCAGGIWAADEAADRAGIEKTIRALSVWPTRVTLFTADFDDQRELLRVVRVAFPVVCPEVWWETCGMPAKIPDGDQPVEVFISKEPWGEATWIPAGMNMNVTRIRITRIRFLTPDVAMVDAVAKDPLLIVMRKVGTDWKIASLRILAEH
jgi:hypothetical protein